MSDYDRWNVQTEFDKSFLTEVATLQPAYLILDFFADIHFGVLGLGDGNYVTDNRWKIHKTDWYEQASTGLTRTSIFADTEAYLELWQQRYRRFDEFVRRELPNTTVVVHRAPNAGMVRLPDRARPVPLQKHTKVSRLDVARANELWRRLDDIAIAISGAESIDLTDVDWVTWLEHPWGPFYVHYEWPYYHRFLAELHQIVLRRIELGRTSAGEVAEMVAEVDRARAEEAALTNADRDRTIEMLRRRVQRKSGRIAELEASRGRRLRAPWRRQADR
jgi:hypothetical protein